LRGSGVAYVQISDYGDYYGYQPQPDWLRLAREEFGGTIVANGGLDRQAGEELVNSGLVDAAAFGALFIANPDLPERFQQEAELNQPDMATFYTQGPEGYTDYPRLGQELPAHLAVTYAGVEAVHVVQ
jgi:N-ethylmaleimide reductase